MARTLSRRSVTAAVAAALLSAAVANADVIVTGDTSSIEQDSPNHYIVTGDFGELAVGISSIGNMTVNGGSTFLCPYEPNVDLDSADFGIGTGGIGYINVYGAGSQITADAAIVVGDAGTAVLTISNGGSVAGGAVAIGGGYFDNGSGTVNVDGAGSSFGCTFNFSVGDFGTGALHLSNGALVGSGLSFVGGYASASGTVTVSSEASWSISDNLIVGDAGHGNLSITSGGSVSAVTGYIGSYIGSDLGTGTVTVDGSSDGTPFGTPSELSYSDSLFIGTFGNGNLTLSNDAVLSVENLTQIGDGGTGLVTVLSGASVSTGTLTLGAGDAGNGTLILKNPGSLLSVSGTAYVGGTAAGSVQIFDGADANTGDLSIGNNPGGDGYVLISGANSTWTSTGSIFIGAQGAVGNITISSKGKLVVLGGTTFIGTSGHGEAHLLAGATAVTQGVAVGNDAGGDGALTIDGAGTTLSANGTVFVGSAGNGTLTLTNQAKITAQGLVIGNSLGGTGNVSIDNASVELAPYGMFVGAQGSGLLNLSNHASISAHGLVIGNNSGGIGNVTLDSSSIDANTSGVYVGAAAPGSLTLSNNSQLLHVDFISVATSAGNSGTNEITIQDPGSSLTVNSSYLGDQATALVFIKNGGTLTTTGLAHVGFGASADGTVSLSGTAANNTPSTWNASGGIVIGEYGQATVHASAGARIHTQASTVTISANTGSNAALVLDDIGTDFDGANGNAFSNLTIADAGKGELDIRDGATISSGFTIIANQLNSTGTVVLQSPNVAPNPGGITFPSFWTVKGQLIVGNAGNATLSISGGSQLHVTSLLISAQAGSFSNMTVSDPGGASVPTVVVDQDAVVNGVSAKDSFTGAIDALSLTKGASFSAASMTIGRDSPCWATVNMDSANTTLTVAGTLTIAQNAFGVLRSFSGSQVDVGSLILGNQPRSLGVAIISGAGSHLTVHSTALIGNLSQPFGLGDSELRIYDSASADINSLTLGVQPGSSGRVGIGQAKAGAPLSTLNVSSPVTVGAAGFGSLSVASFSTFSAPSLLIADQATARGYVSISSTSGTDQSTIEGPITVGNLGSATLTVSTASLYATKITLAAGANSSGTLNLVQGGNLNIATTLTLGNPTSFAGATLYIEGNSTLSATDTLLYQGAKLKVTSGKLNSPVHNIGAAFSVTNFPTIEDPQPDPPPIDIPGGPPISNSVSTPLHPAIVPAAPSVTLTGDYIQTAGSLSLEIDAPNIIAQFLVAGNLSLLGGSLNLSFDDGYLPKTGDSFALFPASDQLSLSPNVTFTDDGVAPGFEFSITPNGGHLTFTALNDAQPLPTPEPAALILTLPCLLLILAHRSSPIH